VLCAWQPGGRASWQAALGGAWVGGGDGWAAARSGRGGARTGTMKC
jgi:hypothetical protein